MFKPGTIHEDILVDHNIRMFGNHLSVTSKYNGDTDLSTLKISCMCKASYLL